VRGDVEGLRMNTAIARLIELNNHLTKLDSVPRDAAEALVLMLAPLAPHLSEELWARLGHTQSLAYEVFPVADPAMLVDETVTCVVQVGGKVRDRLEVPPDVSEDALRERALASPAVQRALGGAEVRTVVVRPPRLVNVVPG
jgi:leucyl-tRNA synthetase